MSSGEAFFVPVRTKEQMEEIALLAIPVWHEHYDEIIGSTQVTYMLRKFQSLDAIREQIQNQDYCYYQVSCGGELAGYFSIQLQADSLFLSKLYLAKKFRGKGCAREILRFITGLGTGKGLHKVWLTVNKENLETIKIYEHLGFVKERTQIAEIGDGFVMDDYIMAKIL